MQGTVSQKIVDAWVSTDNDLEGAFELPAKFPVLKSGASSILIQPGIKMNGVSGNRVPYPFYNSITIPVTLKHEKTDSLINLQTSYKSNTVFAWLEDFEDPNLSIDTTARGSIKLTRYNDPSLASAFPGESNLYAARVVLQNDSVLFECVSHNSFVLPNNGSEVFMELNYKTNCPFTVGLIVYGAQNTQQDVVVVNPSRNWNKIYINFTPTILLNTNAVKYKVFINANKVVGGPDADIMFDNIKLLHF